MGGEEHDKKHHCGDRHDRAADAAEHFRNLPVRMVTSAIAGRYNLDPCSSGAVRRSRRR